MIGNEKIGYGKAFSSFGELVQGRLSNGDDFLVTLPIDLWSMCIATFRENIGETAVICELEKSKRVAEKVLNDLKSGQNAYLKIKFSSNIPVGKGLSSSTADMLATVRAIQEIYGVIVSEQYIARIFNEIEPHDGLQYYSSVIYQHRTGKLIHNPQYIPQFTIVAVDFGGEVDTVDYNKKVQFTDQETLFYDELHGRITKALDEHDDIEIAKLATQSTVLHAKKTCNENYMKLVELSQKLNAMGVVCAHSGTCIGLLFDKSDRISPIVAKEEISSFGNTFQCSTLKIMK